MSYDDFDPDFAEPGGRSALRAASTEEEGTQAEDIITRDELLGVLRKVEERI